MAYSKANEFDARVVTLARMAKALSHPARIAILETLARKATCICGELVDDLPLAQSTVSQHLKELKDAELITGEIDGPKCCYCLNASTVREFETLISSLTTALKNGLHKKKCC